MNLRSKLKGYMKINVRLINCFLVLFFCVPIFSYGISHADLSLDLIQVTHNKHLEYFSFEPVWIHTTLDPAENKINTSGFYSAHKTASGSSVLGSKQLVWNYKPFSTSNPLGYCGASNHGGALTVKIDGKLFMNEIPIGGAVSCYGSPIHKIVINTYNDQIESFIYSNSKEQSDSLFITSDYNTPFPITFEYIKKHIDFNDTHAQSNFEVKHHADKGAGTDNKKTNERNVWQESKAFFAAKHLESLLAIQDELVELENSCRELAILLSAGVLNSKLKEWGEKKVSKGDITHEQLCYIMSLSLMKLSALTQAVDMNEATVCHIKEAQSLMLMAKGNDASPINCRQKAYGSELQVRATKNLHGPKAEKVIVLVKKWVTSVILFSQYSAEIDNYGYKDVY